MGPQLPGIQLRHHDFIVKDEDFGKAPRQRRQVAQVQMADRMALGGQILDRRLQRPLGRSPAKGQHPARIRAGGHFHQRQGVANAVQLGGPQVGHFLMVVGVVGNMARARGPFDPAEPMRQPGHAGNGPGPGQGVRVAAEGVEAVRVDVAVNRVVGQGVHVRQAPGFGRVGRIGVGQHDHRRHVGNGDARRLDHRVEGIAGAAGGEHRQGGFAVAAVQGQVQIRLLDLGRHAGGRPRTLHVDDNQRQFRRRGQAQSLGLQGHASMR